MSKSEKPSQEFSLVPTSALPAGIANRLEVTKDDLIAVAVANKEQKLLAQKEKVEGELKAVGKELETKNKELEKATKPACEAKWGDLIKKASEAIKAIGLPDKIDTYSGLSKKDDKIVLVLRVRYGCNGDELTAPLPANLRVLHNEVESVKKKQETAYEEMVQVRKCLSQLPAMERQARAKWAASVISGTAEGRKFLAEYVGD